VKNNKAFTLIEICLVAGIILLLAAIAIPNILRTRVNANETNAQATLKAIANAMEMYINVNNTYPGLTSDLFSASPPYLSIDYFTGSHYGFNYIPILSTTAYTVHAVPVNSSQGTASYTVSTGGVIQKN